MSAPLFMAILFATLLTGCASKAVQSPISANDPSNPNAPETVFKPRPDWLHADISETAGEQSTELVSHMGHTHQTEDTSVRQPLENATPANLPITTPLPVLYTCPMHPEVVQPSQDWCTKCGMKLVPKNPIKTDIDNHNDQ